MRLKSGRGYVSADKNFDEDLALGYIPIDSVHSPVRKVNFSVEAARLGQMTDYDKLTLEVWTNGAVSPQDAIGYAAKLLKDHMAIFINFEEVPEQTEEISRARHDKMNEVLNRSVEELELSVRSYNCLKNANIQTIGELVQKTEAEMLRTKNFGRKSLNEIKEILANMGLGWACASIARPAGGAAAAGRRRDRLRPRGRRPAGARGIAHETQGCRIQTQAARGGRNALLAQSRHQRHRAGAHRHHGSQGQGRAPAGGEDDHAGQEDTLHSRRQAAMVLRTPASVKKLFDTLGTRFGQRNGGYTRIVRLGPARATAPSRP
jgi:hypothetical protein